jgi:glycosyltransferase involved in cell wall biosynthesis
MNNIEAHYAAYFSKSNRITRSNLRNIAALIKNALKSDIVLFFVRGTEKTYWLLKATSIFNKNIFLFIVQKPEEKFLELAKKHPLRCSYFYLDKEDIKNIKIRNGYNVMKMSVGININKFAPACEVEIRKIKASFGFNEDKPLIVHVGHLSTGRGLEDFLKIDGNRYNRFIVDSGIFNAKELKAKLETNGVTIRSGFIEDIENVYRMADVYFFPTKSGDYVISVPLSVMEALSCGTPVVAYSSFTKIASIEVNSPDAITFIKDGESPDISISRALGKKQNKSYLAVVKSWESAADDVYSKIKDSIK